MPDTQHMTSKQIANFSHTSMSWRKHANVSWRVLPTKFLTATEIRLINARIKGPVSSRVRDEALLDHIVRLPVRQEVYKQEEDLNRLATTLASNLIRNPVFEGGNKRTALLAAGLFLLQNGMKLRATASQVVGNDAVVEVHRGLSAGKIDETEFSELCRHLWRSPVNNGGTEPFSIKDQNEDSIRKLMLSISSTAEYCYQTIAILRSGSYKQKEDHQVVDCLIGNQSIVLDKDIASRIVTGKLWIRSCPITFHPRLVPGGNDGQYYRLLFPNNRKAFDMLGLDAMRRTGVMFLDGPLDYSIVNPTGASGESFSWLEKIMC